MRSVVVGMMFPLLFAAFFPHLLPPGSGFPTGAPGSACEDMVPRHTGVVPQSPPAPYTIQASSQTFQPDQPITVTIKGPGYTGLLLEARSGSSVNALGEWQSPPEDTKFLQCSNNSQGAMTHSNTNRKGNSTTFTWKAPRGISNVYFIATVAQQRTVFWLNISSENLSRGPTKGVGVTISDSRSLWNSRAEHLLLPSLLPVVLCSR